MPSFWIPSSPVFFLGKSLAHSFTSWSRGLTLLMREGAPVPALLNALSTHLMPTHFCTHYFHSVQGILFCSLQIASSPPTQANCRVKLSVNGSLLSSD